MRPKDLLGPLVSAAIGVGLVYLTRMALGHWPHPVVAIGIVLVSVGLGMVAARFSRLGPFDGELGAPWFENDLGETLGWEYERAVRYDRVVTVVALRQNPGASRTAAVVRAVDRVITCRNNWLVMILPETTRDGAMSMLRRLSEAGDVAHAAVLQLPVDIDRSEHLPSAILSAMREVPQPGSVVLIHPHGHEAYSLTA